MADRAGQMLAAFLDASFGATASISFASHSLGARVILETISQMTLPVRSATLMAGAIDDDCLASEFTAAASKIGKIPVLASTKDAVLSSIFPIGNFFAGIIAEGHPWWRAALGHRGPSRPVNGQQELTHYGHDELTHRSSAAVGQAHGVFSSFGSERFDGAGPRSPGPRVTSTPAC